MNNPPTPTIRLTIPVRADVHEAFSKMAEATGQPVGRCMGEWLADTLEGVEFVTSRLVEARKAPRMVVKQMRQELLGTADLMTELLQTVKGGGGAEERPMGAPAAPSTPPRSVIRGGKSTKTGGKLRRNPGV